jgi:hypothetical protein
VSETHSNPWLRRVQALLAKAESTEFTAEAEALLAKAQELMTRHAIDEAMLAATDGRADVIDADTVIIPVPYASAKASLLAQVARANGCRCVRTGASRGPNRCVVVGVRGDLARTTTMFAALSTQAVRAMVQTPVPLDDGARSFRHAFLLGFARRIGERLAAAHATAVADAEAEGAGSDLALVLADRQARVDQAFETRFPSTTISSRRFSSHVGAREGWAAGGRASLGGGDLADTRRAIETGDPR